MSGDGGAWIAGWLTVGLALGCAPARAPVVAADPAARSAVVVFAESAPPANGRPRSAAEPPRVNRPLASGPLARGGDAAFERALAAGDVALDADDWVTARREYGRARELVDTDPAPRVGLARVALAATGLDYAYAASPGDARLVALGRELDAVLAQAPDYAPAVLERGRIALLLGDATTARTALRRAVALASEDAEAHSALAVAELALGQTASALGHFRRAAALEPTVPERLINLGTAYLMRAEVRPAIEAYERAVALAPADAHARGDLGTAYLAAGQPERALPHLERAVALAPDRATFRNNLGYAVQLRGDAARATRIYEEALALDSQLGSAWINLATARAALGDYAAAEAALQRALALDPTDPRALENLAELSELRRAAAGTDSP